MFGPSLLTEYYRLRDTMSCRYMNRRICLGHVAGMSEAQNNLLDKNLEEKNIIIRPHNAQTKKWGILTFSKTTPNVILTATP